jgi:flagellar FliL protein
MASSPAAAGTPPAGNARKRLVVLAAVALLVVGGGAAAAAWFFGLLGAAAPAEAAARPDPHAATADPHQAAVAAPPTVVFVDVPDIVVNLQTTGSRMRFLKLRLSLEVADEPAAQAVKSLMPRLLDSFQLYLRALTVDDLSGPGGVQRLKEDLVARSNIAAEPARINDVLLKEMLIQ